ncbi:MAG: hypothetical protein HYX78_01945 [Armatimonadetes bacterium]|nr:hypothetical protein [Armatimonadota bacterium]
MSTRKENAEFRESRRDVRQGVPPLFILLVTPDTRRASRMWTVTGVHKHKAAGRRNTESTSVKLNIVHRPSTIARRRL